MLDLVRTALLLLLLVATAQSRELNCPSACYPPSSRKGFAAELEKVRERCLEQPVCRWVSYPSCSDSVVLFETEADETPVAWRCEPQTWNPAVVANSAAM